MRLLVCNELQNRYSSLFHNEIPYIFSNCLDKIESYLDRDDIVIFQNDKHFEKVYNM